MIDFPTENELKMLRAFDEPYCLTMYVPFIDPNAATNPNKIEFKNILRQAEIALLDAGSGVRHTRKTLRPARLLLENHEFWPIHHESLVLFMHLKLFRYYHIPDHKTPYLLTVGRGFNVDPLEKVMENDKAYYVLALSHNNVRLYKGGHYRLEPVHLKYFPTNMEETLHIDEYPRSEETHTIAPASSGKGSEAFHGQYNISQTDKTMLAEFFQRIDRRLHPFLMKHRAPLVIAGTGYLLPIYRHANTYPDLLKNDITGNLEHAQLDAIRKKAWRLVGKGGVS